MRWERKVANEARIKIRAALFLAEEGLKKMESMSLATTPGSHAVSAPVKSATKREPVAVPKFVGNEKPGNSPFLEFLVWLENWNQHISDYEEKSRSNLLLSHLDKEATKRIAGMENDYNGAMKKLTDYFVDRRKIIWDCITEVNNFPKVSPNDFKNLVLLKSCIEINYARLKSHDLENEISNT